MSTYLDALVKGEILPGRYRLGASVPIRALRDEVSAAGWTTRLVNGAAMRDRDSLFDEFTAALEFPEWFGRNWDAFADCLGDLSWLPDAGTVVLWRRSGAFAAADPETFEGAGRVIDAAIEARIVAGLSPLSMLYPADSGAARASGGGRSMLRRVQ